MSKKYTAACGCETDELYLHSSCHFASPTWARRVGDDLLIIECAACKREIVRFRIAADAPEVKAFENKP